MYFCGVCTLYCFIFSPPVPSVPYPSTFLRRLDPEFSEGRPVLKGENLSGWTVKNGLGTGSTDDSQRLYFRQ